MDDHRRALDVAFKAVATRERTEQELRELLARRHFDEDVVDDVVKALRDENLVDDAGYARRFTEDRRLLDKWGSERIARDLARRGVDRELIDNVVGGVPVEEEVALAIALLDRRFPMPFAGDRERDKAWRMLVRRGYEPEIAYSAVRRHEQGLGRAA